MIQRSIVLAFAGVLLLPLAVRAQAAPPLVAADNWEGYSAAHPKPSAAPPADSHTAPAATSASPAAKPEPKLVNEREYFLPSDEHSPASAGLALSDPRTERNTANVNGSVGLLHLESAEFGRRGVLHLAVTGEYFRSSNFPTLEASDTRTGGTFALGATFLDWLEGYVSYSASANTNSLSAPPLIQDQGDATFGLKLGGQVAHGLFLGVDARGLLFPGLGSQDVSRSAMGFYPRGLVTYDLHQVVPKAPVRLHANVGYVLDRTKTLTGNHSLTAAEEFALDVNDFNRLALGAGLEVPLPWVTPYVEWDAAVPVGAKDLIAPDNTPVTVGQVMANSLGLGVRVTALKDVSLNAAVDLGLARTVAYGIPATMPWNAFLGASYDIDPFGGSRTKVVEKTIERQVQIAAATPTPAPAAPATGRVEGFALDAKTGKPLPGALVVLDGQGLPPVAADAAQGRFLTYDLPPGPVKVTVEHAGYHPYSASAVVEAGKVTTLDVKLVADFKPATLSVKLVSRGKPVSAPVQVTGATSATIQVQGSGSAPLPPGHYVVAVTADGYQPSSKEIDLAPGDARSIELQLVALRPQAAPPRPERPKKVLVVIQKNKIVIKQQVHFATNKAIILRDSHPLLDQVAEAILSNNLKKVAVEGHTDNVGSPAANLKLSQDRANAVMAYLAHKGVEQSKLSAKGYGDSKPIAPNLTAKGRELNRRVEFTILNR